jgi:transposase-like protein
MRNAGRAAEHPSRWATIVSVSAKIGCTAQTLLEWVKKAEVDSGKRAGVPTDMARLIGSVATASSYDPSRRGDAPMICCA